MTGSSIEPATEALAAPTRGAAPAETGIGDQRAEHSQFDDEPPDGERVRQHLSRPLERDESHEPERDRPQAFEWIEDGDLEICQVIRSLVAAAT